MFDTILESLSQEKNFDTHIARFLNDLNFSASTTVRPKLLASRDRARMTSAASNLAWDLRSDPHSVY